MSVRWNGFEPDREAIHRFECRTRGSGRASQADFGWFGMSGRMIGRQFSASPKIVPVPVARSTNSPWAKSPLSPSERLSQRIPSVDAR
jgi:hypothetical protein